MQQACFKCSRLVLNAAVVSEMLHAWYVLNAAVALMGFRLCLTKVVKEISHLI